MSQLEESIQGIVSTVWESVLGIHIEPENPIAAFSHHEGDSPADHAHTYAGVVQISGAWDGAVTVQCSANAARHAACTMFGLADEDVSVSDLQDALGELTNMTGGNIKALLPETCYLGLPVVVEGADYRFRLPGSLPVRRSTFKAGTELIVVTMLERA
jgi:CheY-specific phosphatase CheX